MNRWSDTEHDTGNLLRYSILPALSLDGVLHMSVEEGSFNAQTFQEFIAGLLMFMNPYDLHTHPKNSVLVMDNCHIHKDEETLAMIHKRYATYYFAQCTSLTCSKQGSLCLFATILTRFQPN